MIAKINLDLPFNESGVPTVGDILQDKLNEVIEYVNLLLEDNNVHERQIDDLQMKIEPEKLKYDESPVIENAIDNADKNVKLSLGQAVACLLRILSLFSIAEGTLTPKSYQWREVAKEMKKVAKNAIDLYRS